MSTVEDQDLAGLDGIRPVSPAVVKTRCTRVSADVAVQIEPAHDLPLVVHVPLNRQMVPTSGLDERRLVIHDGDPFLAIVHLRVPVPAELQADHGFPSGALALDKKQFAIGMPLSLADGCG